MPGPNAFPSPAGPDGLQSISGGCGDADTVRLLTGELMKNVSLVNVPTIGFPLSFRMTYHAQDTVNDVLGPKWRSNYMMGRERSRIHVVEPSSNKPCVMPPSVAA